jgi:dihydrofolate reductase
MVVNVSVASAQHIRDVHFQIGALVTGRRQFDLTGGWGGRHPLDVPVFVVTHAIPQEWVRPDSPFTFVTDGVVRAVEQAKAVAGDKNVAIDGASISQQAIRAGLVDEIGIDLVPVLLGQGVRFFDNLGPEPIELERTSVVAAPGVTHLRFRVAR